MTWLPPPPGKNSSYFCSLITDWDSPAAGKCLQASGVILRRPENVSRLPEGFSGGRKISPGFRSDSPAAGKRLQASGGIRRPPENPSRLPAECFTNDVRLSGGIWYWKMDKDVLPGIHTNRNGCLFHSCLAGMKGGTGYF